MGAQSTLAQGSRHWPRAQKAMLSTADWLGHLRMSGSTSHAHTGCMPTGGSRLGPSDSWLFRATVGVACSHLQLLQYLKWINSNTQGENAGFKIKGKPKRQRQPTVRRGKSFLSRCLVCPPDPGWSLLPCPAWRSLGPQHGTALPAWCCMAEGCWPGGGVGLILGTFHG